MGIHQEKNKGENMKWIKTELGNWINLEKFHSIYISNGIIMIDGDKVRYRIASLGSDKEAEKWLDYFMFALGQPQPFWELKQGDNEKSS